MTTRIRTIIATLAVALVASLSLASPGAQAAGPAGEAAAPACPKQSLRAGQGVALGKCRKVEVCDAVGCRPVVVCRNRWPLVGSIG